jgi:cytochrome c oxidase subunit II
MRKQQQTGLRSLRLASISAAIMTPTAALAELEINLPRGVTPMSRDIYDLHMTIIAVLAVIGVIVYGVLIYTIIRHRHSKGAKPATFDNNLTLENIWTLIPFLILIGMAIPATLVMMDMEDVSDADITVKITGSQWKWHYSYLDQGIEFYSTLSTPPDQIYGDATKDTWYLREVDRPLVLPINKKVRFVVTSTDVIHSWWVPELGVKRDALPGFIYQAWARIDQPGIYRGQCAELCGVGHAFMPIVVKAVSEEEFSRWVAQQKRRHPAPRTTQWTMETAMARGKALFDRQCAACHQEDGSGIPPLYPALSTSSVTVGAPISRHIDLVLNGVPGSAMQAFGPQLDDADLAAIITYERNAWGNDTGDLITPDQVRQRRSTQQTKQENDQP